MVVRRQHGLDEDLLVFEWDRVQLVRTREEVRKCRVSQETIVGIVDEVLEDDHSQFVAKMVEYQWLNLDVLSESVEAQGFHLRDVVFVHLVR